jgi:hypothetical protein
MASSGMLRRVACDLAFLRSLRRLLVRASVVPSSPILVTLREEALRSSETLVLTIGTRRNIPEDAILQVHIKHITYIFSKTDKVKLIDIREWRKHPNRVEEYHIHVNKIGKC